MYSGNQASYDNLSENMKQKLEGLKTPIVNDLTTGGSDKALSAESGKELKSLVDEKVDSEDLKSLQIEVTEHLAQKILEYGGFIEGTINFDTLTPNRLYKVGEVKAGSVGMPPLDVSANNGSYSELEFFDTEGYQTQRITQVVGGKSMMFRSRDARANNGAWGNWQRVMTINTYYPTKTIENTGAIAASKAFPVVTWANNTGSEVCEILIPATLNLSGVIELNLVSTFANSNATGGAKILYHVTASNKTVHSQKMTIIDMSETFANNFHVSEILAVNDWFVIVIVKRKASNPMTINMNYQSFLNDNAWTIMNETNFSIYPVSDDLSTRPIQKGLSKRIDEITTLPASVNAVLGAGWSVRAYNSLTYYKDAFGVVHLRGRVDKSGGTPLITTLPVGYRPLANFESAAQHGATQITYIDVSTDGQVRGNYVADGGNILVDCTFRTT